ncbi:MAG: PAS domain S-box protein, partial [Desulfobacterales bacterium]|nr:PAS domain S-box protein [Desulfobacterales bacterium]
MIASRDNAEGDILIVDDNPDNLELLEKILSENGFRVRASDHGGNALKFIEKNPPDLILLDVEMTGMDGYETCRRLKADPLSADIPVIFISAAKEEQSRVKGFDAGGVDYITRPFQSPETLARVRAHSSMRRMQRHLEEMVHERTSRLEAEKKRFQKLFELASDAFFIHDLEGAILDINREACKSLGYTREEIRRLKVPEIEVGFSNEQIIDISGRVEQGRRVIKEGVHRRKDGTTFSVEVSIGLFRENEPRLLLAIARDISDRKRAEKALEERERYYRTLIFSLHDAVLVIDRDYRVTDVNDSALETMGRRSQKMIGRHCHELLHGRDAPCHEHGEACGLRRVFDTGKSCKLQHDHLGADGESLKIDISMSPMRDENGEITHVVEVMHDVSALVRTEEALHQYAHIVSSTTDMLALLDAEFVYLAANATYLKAFGKTRDELVGRSVP